MEAAKAEDNSDGATCVTRNVGYASPPENEDGFAKATQSATGYSKSQTNRATKRAREVCSERLQAPCNTVLQP